MNNKLRLRIKYAGFVFLLLLVFLCRNSMASIDTITSDNVQIRGDHISIQANGITLGMLLKEIKKKTEIEFKLSKNLMEQKISVGFKGLSLPEGIKKLFYSMNYIIMNDQDGKICKVFIIDEGNASAMMAYNEPVEEFYQDSQFTSNFESTLTEGGNVYTPPGLGFTLTEHPSGTNMPAQATESYEVVLNEGPPGIDGPGQGPPDPEIALIGGPPGMDALFYEPPDIEIGSSEENPGIDLFLAQEGIGPPPGE